VAFTDFVRIVLDDRHPICQSSLVVLNRTRSPLGTSMAVCAVFDTATVNS
jgi:hypothetical protein